MFKFLALDKEIGENFKNTVELIEKGEEEGNIHVDFNNPPKSKCKFITREEWGAVPPISTEEIEEFPVYAVVLPFTKTRKCKSKSACIKMMQQMQKDDMEDGMPDIQNNFYVGGDGNIYEGRGWEIQRSDLGENDFLAEKTLTIAYIGDFNNPDELPPRKMILAVLHLIKEGLEKNYISLVTIYHSWILKSLT